ncbi:hypothetical protein [Clostridium cylindrosporum]|uniref:Uncharacterized protein n=1 Tax=Clostridium cylindrosporum DSM 605 TaxID=1121307 RepID=A0A0J8DA53_CLOCY|nr:hypothetical protein [Clostridium cylindrosporum]KMT22732.1 hypothetical protein CLCY_11c00660 [Clostridium cylindrosporum DSM 605]
MVVAILEDATATEIIDVEIDVIATIDADHRIIVEETTGTTMMTNIIINLKTFSYLDIKHI